MLVRQYRAVGTINAMGSPLILATFLLLLTGTPGANISGALSVAISFWIEPLHSSPAESSPQ